MHEHTQSLRTAIYIDGYNLYYGRLRGTQYKWLDVVALFSQIVQSIEPRSELRSVKFFTAPALTRFARHGEASMKAQNDYHRALEAKYPNVFSKILGTHSYEKDGTALPAFIDGRAFDRSNKVKVWRLVEKKTDVNLAMGMYRDANKKLVDQLVLVSNDSDAEPVVEAILEDFPFLKIGLIMPLPFKDDLRKGRPASTGLSALAHWTRSYIRDDELIKALLPNKVATRKKPATKPSHW
jgi:uncharacterized LabA/DUF88 family protein